MSITWYNGNKEKEAYMLPLYILAIENETERVTAETIYKSYYKNMYGMAVYILKNQHDAEDAVQDAMYRICRNITKFVDLPEDEVIKLIVVYTRNASINIYNDKKKRSGVSEQDLEYKLSDDNYTETKDMEFTSEAIRILSDLMEKLPSNYCDVLLLKYYHNYSLTQIAEVLGIEESSAASKLSRARAALRREWRNSL
jgi:RNA polymerase sigma-70 factor (ECF subfamily)